MNGPAVLPPEYKKHVGRPTRCRRKAPYEVVTRGGGRSMSRHGTIIHCSYCSEPGHNCGGCKWKKAGLPAPNSTSMPPPPLGTNPTTAQQEHQPDSNNVNATTVEDPVVESMSQQV
jgi:hypothetical protein